MKIESILGVAGFCLSLVNVGLDIWRHRRDKRKRNAEEAVKQGMLNLANFDLTPQYYLDGMKEREHFINCASELAHYHAANKP